MTSVGMDAAPRPTRAGEIPGAPPPRRTGRRAALSVLTAVAAGVALLASFPPYGWWWLAPVGVALLTLAITAVTTPTRTLTTPTVTAGDRRRRGILAGAGLGGLTGAVFFTPLLHWTNTQAGWLPWLLLSGSQAAYLALLGATIAYTGRLTTRWPVALAPTTGVLWVAQEALRDRTPFGGFPWARLAFSQADSPLLRFAAAGGAPLVTFAVALTGGLLAAAVLAYRAAGPAGDRAGGRAARAGRYRGVVVGVVAVPVLFALAAAVPLGRPSGQPVRVAFVQGNVPRLGLDFNAQREQVLRNHVAGTEELAARVAAGRVPQPDLVIWPENASDVDPIDDPGAGELITRAARTVRAPILVGSLLLGPGDRVRNVGLVWDPDRGRVATYVKRHPVPFAEYVPLRSLARRVTDKVDLVRSDFLAGNRPGVLRVGPALVGDVICFEIAYDDLVRDTVTGGGQVIVTQTNNATFDADEATQQLAMVRLRAVEHGRDTVMASTVGISAFVSADGRAHAATGFNTPAVEVRELHLSATRTLATDLGAGPEYGLLTVAVVILAGAAYRRSNPRPVTTGDRRDSEGEV